MEKKPRNSDLETRTFEASSEDSTARKIFSAMSSKDKQKMLDSLKERYTKDQLTEMYDLSPRDIETYLVDPEQAESRPKEESMIDYPPFTPENIHVTDTEMAYTPHTKVSPELTAFIASVCSMAAFHKKPYAQINFSNGTAVFEYSIKGGRYVPRLITRPEAVNDFE